MPDGIRGLWGLFVVLLFTVGGSVVGLGVALVRAQRNRRVLELGYAQRLLAAQEEERARVAREVHDDALQRVAVIRHEVESLRRTAPAEAELHKRLNAIAEEVADLSVALREVAHELHPSLIGEVGLPRALDALAAEFSRMDGLGVTLSVPDEPVRLTADAALALYRIAQESLRNVVRHAGVRGAEVSLAVRDGTVELAVRDRGRGFTPAAVPHDRLGLTSMRERAGIAGGRLRIDSAPGRGTSIEVIVPAPAAP